jgi:hypothetical protein
MFSFSRVEMFTFLSANCMFRGAFTFGAAIARKLWQI